MKNLVMLVVFVGIVLGAIAYITQRMVPKKVGAAFFHDYREQQVKTFGRRRFPKARYYQDPIPATISDYSLLSSKYPPLFFSAPPPANEEDAVDEDLEEKRDPVSCEFVYQLYLITKEGTEFKKKYMVTVGMKFPKLFSSNWAVSRLEMLEE